LGFWGPQNPKTPSSNIKLMTKLFHSGQTGHHDAIGHLVHKEFQHTHFYYVKKYEIEETDKQYKFGHEKCDYRSQLDYVNKVILSLTLAIHSLQVVLPGDSSKRSYLRHSNRAKKFRQHDSVDSDWSCSTCLNFYLWAESTSE